MVATISRLLKIIGLFCRILSLLQGSSARETNNFKEPTNHSHHIAIASYERRSSSPTSGKETHSNPSESVRGMLLQSTNVQASATGVPNGQQDTAKTLCETIGSSSVANVLVLEQTTQQLTSLSNFLAVEIGDHI